MEKSIKVKDTRMHKTTTSEWQTGRGTVSRNIEVPVAEAELVFIGCDPKESLVYRCNNGGNLYLTGGQAWNAGFYFKPILISRTEKIEVGDWTIANGNLEQVLKMQLGEEGVWQYKTQTAWFSNCKKVLALPQHFSPKHLQVIVDGKLKDGDKVLVECGEPCILDKDYKGGYNCEYCKRKHMDFGDCQSKDTIIKLNSSNHITLYKAQEPTYTEADLFTFCEWLNDNWRRGKRGWFHVGDFFHNGKPVKTEDLAKMWIKHRNA